MPEFPTFFDQQFSFPTTGLRIFLRISIRVAKETGTSRYIKFYFSYWTLQRVLRFVMCSLHITRVFYISALFNFPTSVTNARRLITNQRLKPRIKTTSSSEQHTGDFLETLKILFSKLRRHWKITKNRRTQRSEINKRYKSLIKNNHDTPGRHFAIPSEDSRVGYSCYRRIRGTERCLSIHIR